MPTSPVEAEATGQEFVTAAFGGRSWTIRLDVDTWPVDLVTETVAPVKGGFQVNYRRLAAALQELLGVQWPQFLALVPKRRDLLPASQAFAAAVGFPVADRADVAFGAIPRILREIDKWPAAVEATLHQFGHDYRDRYLFTVDRRRLTLRQINVALSHAPFDSPIAIARNGGRRPLSDTALAVMDLYEAITRRSHNLRPLSEAERTERESAQQKESRAVADYKQRHNQPTRTPAQERRRTAADVARSNAQFAQQRKAAAHGR